MSPLDRFFLLQDAQREFQQAQQGITPIDAFFLEEQQNSQQPEQRFSIERAAGDALVGAVRLLQENPLLRQIERIGRRIRDPLAIREIIEAAPDGREAVREALARESGQDLATLAGILKGGALDPARSIAQLAEASLVPAVKSAELPTENPRVSDWIARAEQGSFDAAETYALSSGVSQSEITAAYEVGNFLGIMAPITGSVKAAGLVTGTAIGTLSKPWVRNIITDTAAGAVYGGLFVPETELSKRMENSRKMAAEFGIGSILVTSLLPIQAFRTRRSLEKRMRQGLLSERSVNPGAIIDEPASLASLLNEEQLILSSPSAQRILVENADERALIQAITEVSGSRGSGGVLRQASTSFESAARMQDRFREQFPGLKFDVVKNREGAFDVFFGTKGLSNRQRAQLKNEGRFEGLEVDFGDATYSYVGRASRKDFVKVRDQTTGKVKEVKEENITDRFTFSEPVDRTPELDALYRDFSRYYDDGQDAVLTARGGTTEGDWIQAVARGERSASPADRRAFDQAGAIVNPEELGPPVAQRVSEGDAVPGARGPLEPASFFTFDDIVGRWATERGLPIDAADFPVMMQHFAARKRAELWESVLSSDKAVYEKILKKNDELVERFGISLEQWAGGKGFQTVKLPTGQVMLREINTGAPWTFGSEAAARDWLKSIVRPEAGLPSDLPPMTFGMQAATNRGSGAYDVWPLEGVVGTLEGSQRLPALNGVRPVREAFLSIEQQTGLPVATQGYIPVDEGIQRLRVQYAPWADEIADTWRGVSPDRRRAISDVWQEIEGTEMGLGDAVSLFRGRGFSPKEISAFTRSRQILDRLFDESGIDANRYINMYYSRILPTQGNYRADGLSELFSGATKPSETSFFAEFTRTGQLPIVETDPELILHKYVRSLLWNKEVKPAYDRFSQLVGQRGSDGAIRPITFLDLQKQFGEEAGNAIWRKARPGTPKDSPVIPGPLRDFISEYLNAGRGVPDKSWDGLRNFASRVFDDLGVKADPRVLEEALNTWMSIMYGAAIGLRPALIARNLTQNYWMLYSRIGNKHMGPGLERAMSREGFQEALEEGILRVHEGGVPLHDAIFRNLTTESTNGPLNRLLMSGMQRAKRLNQTSLQIYSTSDQLNRAWAYFSQKGHTADALLRYEQGKIGWDRFVEDGLPFFKKPLKDRFRQIYDTEGKERALRWIGRQASDEANFIYGTGGSPAWMQSPAGRAFGMFGQWPLWSAELYLSRFRTGTPKQKAAFLVRTAALSGIFANIAYESGTNMWNWIAPQSLFTWGGGPATDYLANLKTVLEAPMEQKPAALGRLASNVLRLSFPGQVAFNDVSDALDARSPDQAIFRLYLGRPSDELDWIGNWEVDPRTLEDEAARGYRPTLTPETDQALRDMPTVPLGLSSPRARADQARAINDFLGPEASGELSMREPFSIEQLLTLLPRPAPTQGLPRPSRPDGLPLPGQR